MNLLIWMSTITPPTIPKYLSLPVATHTKSHQFSFNSCWNACVLHKLLPNTNHITCPVLNFSINSFCPPDTALLLTTDNFHSIFPPSFPLLPSSCSFPWWLLLKIVTWCHLYIYSLMIEKEPCECQNVSVNFLCAPWPKHLFL